MTTVMTYLLNYVFLTPAVDRNSEQLVGILNLVMRAACGRGKIKESNKNEWKIVAGEIQGNIIQCVKQNIWDAIEMKNKDFMAEVFSAYS